MTHDPKTGWTKKGDLAEVHCYGSEAILEREAEYINNADNSRIKKIDVLGDKDGNLRIYLHINNQYASDVFDKLSAHGYPYADNINRLGGRYMISIPNTVYLCNFLLALTTIEPSVSYILQDIVTSSIPYCPQEKTIPGWVKGDNFDYARNFGRGTILLREESFKSCGPEANAIQEIYLLGYKDGEVRISLHLDAARHNEIVNSLSALGHKTDSNYVFLGFYMITIPDQQYLARFLRDLAQIQPSVNNIKDGMMKKAASYLPEQKQSYSILVQLRIIVLAMFNKELSGLNFSTMTSSTFALFSSDSMSGDLSHAANKRISGDTTENHTAHKQRRI